MKKLFYMLLAPVALVGMEQKSLEQKIKGALADSPRPHIGLGFLQLTADMDESGREAMGFAELLSYSRQSRAYNFRQEALSPNGYLTKHVEQLQQSAGVAPEHKQRLLDLVKNDDASVLRHVRVFELCMDEEPCQDVFRALAALALAHVRHKGNPYLLYQEARFHAQTLPFTEPLINDVFVQDIALAHNFVEQVTRWQGCQTSTIYGILGYLKAQQGQVAGALRCYQIMRESIGGQEDHRAELEELQRLEAELQNNQAG